MKTSAILTIVLAAIASTSLAEPTVAAQRLPTETVLTAYIGTWAGVPMAFLPAGPPGWIGDNSSGSTVTLSNYDFKWPQTPSTTLIKIPIETVPGYPSISMGVIRIGLPHPKTKAPTTLVTATETSPEITVPATVSSQ